jgi:hypothetical protein
MQETRDKRQDAPVAERCTEFIEMVLEATRCKKPEINNKKQEARNKTTKEIEGT